MGIIRQYNCNCGYQMRFFAGAGLNGCNVSVIERFFPEDGAFIREERAQMERYLLDHALAECADCKELKTVLRLTYKRKGAAEPVCKIQENCQSCSGILQMLAEEEVVKCPKCGEQMMGTDAGHWD